MSVLSESESILKSWFFDTPKDPQLYKGDASEFFSLDSVIRDQYPIDFIGRKKNPWPLTRRPGDPYRDRVLNLLFLVSNPIILEQ